MRRHMTLSGIRSPPRVACACGEPTDYLWDRPPQVPSWERDTVRPRGTWVSVRSETIFSRQEHAPDFPVPSLEELLQSTALW